MSEFIKVIPVYHKFYIKKLNEPKGFIKREHNWPLSDIADNDLELQDGVYTINTIDMNNLDFCVEGGGWHRLEEFEFTPIIPVLKTSAWRK